MPRLLILAPIWDFQPRNGGDIRILEISSEIAKRFDVDIVGLARNVEKVPSVFHERYLLEEKKRSVINRIRSFCDGRRPYHVNLYYSKETQEAVQALLKTGRYGLVYSHFLYPLVYLQGAGIPVVVDQQNVDRVYWANKLKHTRTLRKGIICWNLARTIAFESRNLEQVRAYVSVSAEDSEITRSYACSDSREFWVVPNGVDTHRFSPQISMPKSEILIGYLGSLDMEMNLLAVHRLIYDIWPKVVSGPGGERFQLQIIGKNPTGDVYRWARSTKSVEVVGEVEDVVPFLNALDLFACPITMGAGTKLKIVEAMACGLPVVGTPLALAGIDGVHGRHFVEATSDEDFVMAIRALADNRERRLEIGEAARSLVCEKYDWGNIGKALSENLRGLLDRK